MTGRLLAIAGAVLAGLFVVLVVEIRRGATPSQRPPHDASPHVEQPAVKEDSSQVGTARPDASPQDVSAQLAARNDRELVLGGLRESGTAVEAWDAQGMALLSLLAHGDVEIHGAACYVGRCAATFTFSNESEYRHRVGELSASDAYREWTGGKRLTTPETRDDGRVVVVLALYRPD